MTAFWNSQNVIVTGGAGFLGRYVVDRLEARGAIVFVPRSADYDLTRQCEVKRLYTDRPGATLVIHLAATVGGIGFNLQEPGRLLYENAIMGLHLMEQARLRGVQKFISVGTICEYPKFTPVPFKETDLWNGYPEETNAHYGLAKKLVMAQGQAYAQQYGFNAIHVLPTNLYGPGDNIDPRSSHVIPALIRRMIRARNKQFPYVEVWGSGAATREFLFVSDAAEGIIAAAERYNEPDPINLGTGQEISIRELVAKIKHEVGYRGIIYWDQTKPDGQPRRRVDTTRALTHLDWRPKTGFDNGLIQTVEWLEGVEAALCPSAAAI